MGRRDLVADKVGLTALGAGAAYDSRSPGEEAVQPVESPLVELFATLCNVCQGMMGDIREVNEEVGGNLVFTDSPDAAGVPTTVVVDENNEVVACDKGGRSADEITEKVRTAQS